VANDEVKHVFVSYVREDAVQVDRLCDALEVAQIPYWRDRNSLDPGDQWRRKIRDAIRSGALVFLACFSEQSRAKRKSYMNEELVLAAEEFRQLAPGATWLIPVRFDDGDLPDLDLGAGRALSDLNYADLFGEKYATEAIKLITTIGRTMGIAGPNAATMRASVEEVGTAERPATFRRMTKEMIVDPARRIELDDLVSEETQRVLSSMQDEEQFPIQRPNPGAAEPLEDRVLRCVRLATSYWLLVEPLCSSLQVAARWADEQSIAPWVSALTDIAAEAMKLKGGNSDLLALRHVPAFVATFTSALAASGQARWDNIKSLLVDVTFPDEYNGISRALVQVEHSWVPFEDWRDLVPNVLARAASDGKEPSEAFVELVDGQNFRYHTPVADWLHAILRSQFSDQYRDAARYDDAFDRTEVILGLISQDLSNVQAQASGRWVADSGWYGRSTWRSRRKAGALDVIGSEIESQGTSWAPLRADLFGGDPNRVAAALDKYKAGFNERAQRFF
jgi:hypothetical protein